MTRRKHGHRRDNAVEFFMKGVSGIISKVKPRTNNTLIEGTRLMTRAEERAAIEAVNEPRQREEENEFPLPEPVKDNHVHVSPSSIKKHNHHSEDTIKGFRRWFSDVVSMVKPRRRKTLTEGTRFMTHAEKRAALEVISLPRKINKVSEITLSETEDKPVVNPVLSDRVQEFPRTRTVGNTNNDAPDLEYVSGGDSPAPQKVHRRRQARKRKTKRWLNFFNRKKKRTPVLMGLSSSVSLQTENVVKKKKTYRAFIKPTINSTALFVLAYLVVWFTYQFVVMIQASFSNIDSVLFYYEVMFPIGNYSQLWSQFNIILITASGPIFSVLMGIVYRYVFLKHTKPGNQMRLLLVWLYLISMTFFFGAFVAGIITNQGFGFVAGWLYMNIVFRIGISLLFLFILAFLGWKAVGLLPEVSGSDSFRRNRRAFVISRLTIPWLIGSVLMLILKRTSFTPQHANIYAYDMIIIGSILFPVVAAIFNKHERPYLYKTPHRSTSARTIAIWVIAAIIVALLVRFGLDRGLYLQLKILLDVGMYR